MGCERPLRHFRVVEAGRDDLFQHMPPRDKFGRIFECLVFEDAEDLVDRGTHDLRGDLRRLARGGDRESTRQGRKP